MATLSAIRPRWCYAWVPSRLLYGEIAIPYAAPANSNGRAPEGMPVRRHAQRARNPEPTAAGLRPLRRKTPRLGRSSPSRA